jgi:hypothetical protein
MRITCRDLGDRARPAVEVSRPPAGGAVRCSAGGDVGACKARVPLHKNCHFTNLSLQEAATVDSLGRKNTRQRALGLLLCGERVQDPQKVPGLIPLARCASRACAPSATARVCARAPPRARSPPSCSSWRRAPADPRCLVGLRDLSARLGRSSDLAPARRPRRLRGRGPEQRMRGMEASVTRVIVACGVSAASQSTLALHVPSVNQRACAAGRSWQSPWPPLSSNWGEHWPPMSGSSRNQPLYSSAESSQRSLARARLAPDPRPATSAAPSTTLSARARTCASATTPLHRAAWAQRQRKILLSSARASKRVSVSRCCAGRRARNEPFSRRLHALAPQPLARCDPAY